MSYKLNATCLKVIFAAVFMLVFQFSRGQVNPDGLNAIMEQKAKALKNNSLVLAVASKDTLIYKNDTKLFNINRSQAPAGYSSQWFTTALVMMMVDEGKFNLDDKVVDYLPEFAKYGKNFITIRNCLSHFTGIQVSKTKLFEKSKRSLEDEVNSYAAREIQTNPGTEFRYNDIGFFIAARIVEVVSKKKFEMLAQQRLFRPLGMRQTTFTTIDGSAVNPSHGARTTASDFLLFMQRLLNKGKLKGQQILTEESMTELRRIHGEASALKNVPKEVNGYDYALGAWAPESKDSSAALLVAPSYGGSVAAVDFCRGYAFVYLLKELNEDAKANAYKDIKGELDGMFTCREK
jgi:CubicO group peptidase (beta-lactamase class C family)